MHEFEPEARRGQTEPPSKSERKRAAHAAQALGEALIGLRDRDLQALELPAALLEAVREARGIRSRAAAARQRQFIGKLMRRIDLEPIRRALAEHSARNAQEAQHFQQIEHWRARLLVEGEAALDELAAARPDLDRGHWTRLLRAARAERPAGAATQGPAGRALFRALRGLLR